MESGPIFPLDWHPDALSVGVLALLAWAYVRGSRRIAEPGSARAQRKRPAMLFGCGWIALAAAFGPPLHGLTGVSFAAHMVQHEILMLVAAPLIVLARPHGVLMWGLPDRLSTFAGSVTRSTRTRRALAVLVTPLGAWLLHVVVLWGWHVPAAFDAALANEALHWFQHAGFFVSAAIFWYSVTERRHRAPAVISLFTTAVHTSLLGVLLTFASSAWYRAYTAGSAGAGLSPLEDQQLGGLIMWVPGGVVFAAAALAIVAGSLTANGARPARRGEPAEGRSRV